MYLVFFLKAFWSPHSYFHTPTHHRHKFSCQP
jgi:hypothetical protein